MFTTGYLSNKFLVKTNQMKSYFMLPLECPKNIFFYFHPYVSEIKYVQHEDNTSVFSSLAYAIEHVAEQAVALRLTSYVKSELFSYMDSIKFPIKL